MWSIPTLRSVTRRTRPPPADLTGFRHIAVALLGLSATTGCRQQPSFADLRPAGEATRTVTVGERDRPSPRLSREARPRHHAGRALASQPWVPAPSVTDARDGLGPLYNAASCLTCHVRGGASPAPAGGGRVPAGVTVRLGADPVYGAQLQTQTVDVRARYGARTDGAPAEGEARVVWARSTFLYPDGDEVELRAPKLAVEALAYGPLDADTRPSLRMAPPLYGAGLLASIPDEVVAARADPSDRDEDGISGRLPPGRFGWKGEQVNLREQIALAFRRDMGI
ncbi:MAG: di-heme oxidoredictase family protein, partial [Myxococcota bacterium]